MGRVKGAPKGTVDRSGSATHNRDDRAPRYNRAWVLHRASRTHSITAELGTAMDANTTAILLVGYQNDYFSPDGALHAVIEKPAQVTHTLDNTLFMIDALAATRALMITTPILFTPAYEELIEPVGILRTIRDAGAFRAGSTGGATIPELLRYGDRLLEVPGKRGLNAFSNTELDEVLAARAITDVVLCGVVASICIDSTGRAAFERGYRVTVLSDCVSGRTLVEQDFYVTQIYPLYARVMTSREMVGEMLHGR